MAPRRLPSVDNDGHATLLANVSEKEWQAHVLEVAERLGWTWWHDAASNRPRRCYRCGAGTRGERNTKGLPDLLLVRGDRLIWVELKKQDGVTSTEQRKWIADLRAAGQTVYVWRPADWDTIERVLT